MIKVSATRLRNNLFAYLDKAVGGETIVIQRKNQDVARLVSAKPINWRSKITIKPEILVSPQQLIVSMDDVWEEYIEKS